MLITELMNVEWSHGVGMLTPVTARWVVQVACLLPTCTVGPASEGDRSRVLNP